MAPSHINKEKMKKNQERFLKNTNSPYALSTGRPAIQNKGFYRSPSESRANICYELPASEQCV